MSALSKILEIQYSITSLQANGSLTGLKLSYCKDVPSLLKMGFVDEIDAQIFLEEHLLSWKEKGVPVSMLEVNPMSEEKLSTPTNTTTSSLSPTVCELSWGDIDLEADGDGKAIIIGHKQ